MNRNSASLVLAVRDTVDRVRRGESPYEGPAVGCDMIEASLIFSTEVDHSAFYAGIEERFVRGEDPREFITNYLGIVFAQGFTSGARFEEERNR